MSSETTASFDEQYWSLRLGGGAVELVDWSSITVSGADRQTFLNSFCTNDIKRLNIGHSCEAFFTNVKGKIIGHGVVSCRENELVIVGVPGQASQLIEHLDRYVIREDVQLQNTTAERSFLLVAGGSEASELYQKVIELACVASASVPCNLVGSIFETICEVVPRDLPLLLEAIRDRGIVSAGPAFYAARIEAGAPLFHVDFDENNFPQEVGRDREAISFTKGCYLGQETVARIDALGHVNQRIVGVRFFGGVVPNVGTEISREGAVVGRVTSASFSPRLSAPLALAMVRREANAPGTALESSLGKCEVIALPLQSAAVC